MYDFMTNYSVKTNHKHVTLKQELQNTVSQLAVKNDFMSAGNK